MLTDGLMAANRVKLMNVFDLKPELTVLHGMTSSGAAEPFGREKPMVNLTMRRMKWPFSVAPSSIAKAPAAPEANLVYPDEGSPSCFVT
jgi:hypothetical protein